MERDWRPGDAVPLWREPVLFVLELWRAILLWWEFYRIRAADRETARWGNRCPTCGFRWDEFSGVLDVYARFGDRAWLAMKCENCGQLWRNVCPHKHTGPVDQYRDRIYCRDCRSWVTRLDWQTRKVS